MRAGVIAVLCAAAILAVSACERDEYAEGLAAYRAEDYETAFRKFTFCYTLEPDSDINDYYLYYAGRCALKTRRYADARSLFDELLSTQANSILRDKALQYRALADFLLRGSPADELTNTGRSWVFVGNAAAHTALAATNTNTAYALWYKIIAAKADAEAAMNFRRNFDAKPGKNRYPADFMMQYARALLSGGEHTAGAAAAAALTNDRTHADEALYTLALCVDKEGREETAERLYREYLSRFQSRRERALLNLIEVYRSLNRVADTETAITNCLALYPKGASANYLQRRLVLSHLSQKDIPAAHAALAIGVARALKDDHINMAARNYLRTMYEKENEAEARWALEQLRKIHAGGDRYDYYLSWAHWVHKKFGNTNEMKQAISSTLHMSKNPFLIAEALIDADDAMLASVTRSNTAAFAEAERYRAATNHKRMLEALNRVQFIDTARTDMPAPDLIRAQKLAAAAVNEHPFVRALTSPMSDEDIALAAMRLSPVHAKKAFVLSLYGDHDNAENEMLAVRAEYPASPTVIRALMIISSNANDYGKIFRYTGTIGDYMNYPFRSNPYLLPRVLRRFMYPEYYQEYVETEAQHNGIEPAFLYALIRGESAFDTQCVSWANANGLMQLLYSTAASANRDHGRKRIPEVDLLDPGHNIILGTLHLKALLSSYNGDYYYTLAAYNAGGGSVKRWRESPGRKNPYLFTRLIDYPETEYYVEKVMRNCHHYRLLAAEEAYAHQAQ